MKSVILDLLLFFMFEYFYYWSMFYQVRFLEKFIIITGRVLNLA